MITNKQDFNNYPNFAADEFSCQHCSELKISETVLDFCQAWRDFSKSPVTIYSGYRCSEHNTNVSNTGEDGPHTSGLAIDLKTNTNSQYKLINFALHYHTPPTGIGIGKTFTHLDWLTIDHDQKYVVRPNVWRY